MSILSEDFDKFMELDIFMHAVLNDELDFEDNIEKFATEHCYNWSEPGMCFIKYVEVQWGGGYYSQSFKFLKINEDSIEAICQCPQLKNEFKYTSYSMRGINTNKYPSERWFFIEPEYFEHVKSMAGPDQIIRL